MGRWLALLSCAAALGVGCEPVQPAQVSGGALTVYSAQPGLVRAGEAAAVVTPFGPTQLFGVGAQIFSLRLERSASWLLLRDAQPPLIDLRPLQGAHTQTLGQPVDLYVTVAAGPGDRVHGALLRAEQRSLGQPDEDGLHFQMAGDGPATLLVGWYQADRLLALDRVALPRISAYSGMVARPRYTVDAQLLVDVPAARPGWVSGELTLEGVRTGVLVGGGLAGGPRGLSAEGAVAAALPMPDHPAFADLGLWLQVEQRAVDLDEPLLILGEHLPITARQHAAQVPAEGALFSGLADTVERAAPLWAPGVLRAIEPVQAGWIDGRVDAHFGCERQRWRLLEDRPGAHFEVVLRPEELEDSAQWPLPEPVMAPLLALQLSEMTLGEARLSQVVSAGGPRPEIWPKWGRMQRRTQRGYARGLRPACLPADARRGLYAVQREADQCVPGAPAARVWIDGCGEVHALSGAGELGQCGQAQALLLDAQLDGALPLRRGGRLVPVAAQAVAVPPSLLGGWYRVEVRQTLRERAPPGEVGAIIDRPATIFVGGPAQGPWFEVGETGAAQLRAGALEGQLAFTRAAADGGTLRQLAPDCVDEPGEWAATVREGALVLTRHIVEPQVERTLEVSLWRR